MMQEIQKIKMIKYLVKFIVKKKMLKSRENEKVYLFKSKTKILNHDHCDEM